jgi:hypothetical protein
MGLESRAWPDETGTCVICGPALPYPSVTLRLGQVAQLAEHAAENRGVGSSILPLATQFITSRLRTSAHRLRTPW